MGRGYPFPDPFHQGKFRTIKADRKDEQSFTNINSN
jgi:hypothetical protein